jgi:hypothetical protein
LWLEGSFGTRSCCLAVIRGYDACYISRIQVIIVTQKVFAKLGLVFGFSGFPPTRARSLRLLLIMQPTSNCPDLGITLLLYEQWSPGVYSTPPAENSYQYKTSKYYETSQWSADIRGMRLRQSMSGPSIRSPRRGPPSWSPMMSQGSCCPS